MTILLLALTPAMLIVSLFFFLDKHHEPMKSVLRAFAWGCASLPIVYLLYWLFQVFDPAADGTLLVSLRISYLNAGFLEELSKYIVFLAAIYRYQEFDEWYDGIFYGICIGTGFAFIENIEYFHKYIPEMGAQIVVNRSILSMPLHALLGGIMGYFLGEAKFVVEKNKVPNLFVLALLLPIIIHGTYDFVLFYYRMDLSWTAIPIVGYLWMKVLQLKRVTQSTITF